MFHRLVLRYERPTRIKKVIKSQSVDDSMIFKFSFEFADKKFFELELLVAEVEIGNVRGGYLDWLSAYFDTHKIINKKSFWKPII